MNLDEYNLINEYTPTYDIDGELTLEAKLIDTSYIVRDELYPKIKAVMSTPVGESKFKQIVGKYVDKNSEKLHTPGPQYLIPFGDIDKGMYFRLFNITDKEVKAIAKRVCSVIKQESNATNFRLIEDNPIFFIFYCVIRFYTVEKPKDKQGLNTALIIYALAAYPSIFSKYFKYGVSDVGAMLYTVDNLTQKFILKKSGHIFGMLNTSIQSSYSFLSQFMADGSDKEVVRFIQRIRNDQNSLVKKVANAYNINHNQGNTLDISRDQFNDTPVVDDKANNTMIVEKLTNKIALPIITNGLDTTRAEIAAKISGISISDCSFYIGKILTDKNQKSMVNFIQAILFLFIYTDRHKAEDINSSMFLTWASELFRKTNSKDENIATIKTTLDVWAESVGVHAKFKREASRINYKKAIFLYFVMSIQKFNNTK